MRKTMRSEIGTLLLLLLLAHNAIAEVRASLSSRFHVLGLESCSMRQGLLEDFPSP